MKHHVLYILFFTLISSPVVIGQNDSIHELEEVVLSDVRLYQDRNDRLQVLSDSLVKGNPAFLTDLLRSNTFLHLRENGRGMVSSVSFRGTSPSQTAVVWNGININSVFNGQTDFNTLIASHYDHITLRTGGGSLMYGSGALGGSVHLNNRLRFDKGITHETQLRYGSFNTFFGSYKGEYSQERTNVQLNLSRYGSDNDYPYPDSEGVNENGDFTNTGINLAMGQRIGSDHVLKLFSNYTRGKRGFSGTLAAASKSKIEELTSRNLVEWKSFYEAITTTLKLAYLDEQYDYYEDREDQAYSFGRAKTGVLKYDLKYHVNSSSELSGILDLQHTSGEGSNIGEEGRGTAALGLLFKQEWDKFHYGLGLRHEVSNVYQSPVLFSLNTGYSFSDYYSLNLNFSRNYRVPTFNDLFWSTGGNENLEPEHSLQGDLTHHLEYKNLDLRLTTYVIKIRDLLRWVPGSNGIWKPENTRSVRNYGLELLLQWQKKFGMHRIRHSSTYAYTRSTDLDLDKDLVYVPRHKMTSTIAYHFKRISSYYQLSYTGKVYTSSDNNYGLAAYTLSNIGVTYSFLKDKKMKLGLEVHNLWDTAYLSQPSRPMPGTSLNGTLIFKF